jgi:periplasmic divalent cation tolerance protein
MGYIYLAIINTCDMELVYVVAADMAEAERLARGLVEQRLAACVNIIPGMKSVYRWNGAVETAEEVAMLVKTGPGYFADVEEYVRKHHSYEVPAIFSLSAEGVSGPYRDWLSDQLDEGN